MIECKLGYYFARLKDSDEITIVGCWGDRVDKTVKQDVEILEPIPKCILSVKSRILNLQQIRDYKRQRE